MVKSYNYSFLWPRIFSKTFLNSEAVEHFEMRGGGRGGLISHSAIPLLKFSKMLFALFIGTSKPLCNLHSVKCVCNLSVTTQQ